MPAKRQSTTRLDHEPTNQMHIIPDRFEGDMPAIKEGSGFNVKSHVEDADGAKNQHRCLKHGGVAK